MPVLKPVVYDGGLQRQMLPGDALLSGAEVIDSTLTTAGAGTILARQFISGILSRTGPVAGFIDTTDSAANIINAMIGNYNFSTAPVTGMSAGTAVQPQTTFRLRYLNTVAFAMTLAAGVGVTLGANTGAAASSFKDLLVTITNGTPQAVIAGNTVNASPIITGMSQFSTSQISVGQLVTGTGIPASATVISIQQGIGFTLSANATASNINTALTFNPTLRIDGIGGGLLA